MRKDLTLPSASHLNLKPVVAQSVAEEVYQRLRQAIVDGDIGPGQRLIERALADSLQVSRTPVREALKQLTAEGLVSVDGHRGLIVARLSIEFIQEAYQAREVLEGLAARLAAQNRYDPEDMTKLEETLVKMESGSLSYKEFDLVHATFHDTIASMSGNSYVIRYLQDLAVFRTRMVSLEWIPKIRVHASLPEHRKIVDAIREGQPDEAEKQARKHVMNTRQTLINRLTADNLTE
ncbi:MAG: GntR family transcriptional regulator [Firmicutes bacterium]|nr:GntR family transcriptional regulator [Bacillota bacterium]MCL5013678.1 GntR family transcriptional regulator [Bacillota bacterium]